MTFNFDIDSAILLAILGTAARAVWLLADLKATVGFVVGRVENHEQRIAQLEQR